MREIGANPVETVYVGDSEVDLATAQNSGLKCVAVSWGFRDRGELVGRGAKISSTPPPK
ncbi:MAG: HAD family hydrolase [Christensenellales bacterium]